MSVLLAFIGKTEKQNLIVNKWYNIQEIFFLRSLILTDCNYRLNDPGHWIPTFTSSSAHSSSSKRGLNGLTIPVNRRPVFTTGHHQSKSFRKRASRVCTFDWSYLIKRFRWLGDLKWSCLANCFIKGAEVIFCHYWGGV